MAAELNEEFGEEAELIQSSGGVFEVEHNSSLVFSKKKENRFPEEGEVLRVVKAVQSGKSLEESRNIAAAGAPKPPSFSEWFSKLFGHN